MYANARSVFDHARSDLDQALTYRCELSLGQRAGLGDGGAHAMHKPERRGVEDEPYLIGGRVMARHAVREELRLVQFDQVLHLPALAIDPMQREGTESCLSSAITKGDRH
jgi:hypothetical protein